MSTSTLPHLAQEPDPQRRLAILSHLIRWLSIAWVAWGMIGIVTHWSDAGAIAKGYGLLLDRDLSALPVPHHSLGYVVFLLDWLFAAAVAYRIWQLFGHYLVGRIFDRVAVDAMQRLAWTAAAAVVADIAARPVLAALLTAHLGSANMSFKVWTAPSDLLHVLMALFFVVLANVFAAGVALAEDNRQIV